MHLNASVSHRARVSTGMPRSIAKSSPLLRAETTHDCLSITEHTIEKAEKAVMIAEMNALYFYL